MEEQIVEILSAIQSSTESLAPVAWDALVIGARMNSILTVAYMCTVAVLVVVYLKNFPKIQETWEDELVFGSAFVLGVLSVIAVVGAFFTSTWLGLFNPEAQAILSLISDITQ